MIKLTDRLSVIEREIPKCKVFADIGCDHGYISKTVLDSKKAERVIFSDVSEKSLSKAEKLLDSFVKNGVAKGYVSDGFKNIPDSDVALIAGMGGEEIVSILSGAKSLPNTLILQPMRNLQKVRKTLIDLGYKIDKDFTFKSGKKFYELIVSNKGKDSLTEEEIEFGRTNVKDMPSDFCEMIKEEILKLDCRLTRNLSDSDRISMLKRKKVLEKYV